MPKMTGDWFLLVSLSPSRADSYPILWQGSRFRGSALLSVPQPSRSVSLVDPAPLRVPYHHEFIQQLRVTMVD